MSNPFITELTPLETEDLIHLDGILSGRWLANVRRELNLRTFGDEWKTIRARVSPHSWSVICGGGSR
jgi:hypothetical protein